MGTLDNHIKKNCDPKMMGLFSLSIKEAYRFFENLKRDNPLLQREEMKKSYGHMRNGLVDIGLKEVLSSTDFPHKIADKTTSKYRNGYTYLMIEVKGAILTPVKITKPHYFPRQAAFRSRGSLVNQQYNLFDPPESLNSKYDEENPPFLMITYGGSDFRLDFIQLGLPESDASGWIDRIDITNAPALIVNRNKIIDDLHLTFTSEAEKIIRKGDRSVVGEEF